jgi:hypothetical protein
MASYDADNRAHYTSFADALRANVGDFSPIRARESKI